MSPLELIFKNFLEPFAYLIYGVIFFFKSRKGHLFENRVLFAYYVADTILLIFASLMVLYPRQDVDNNWTYNVVYFINVCVLSWYFYRILQASSKKFVVLILLAINAAIFLIYDLLLAHFIGSYNGYVYAICCISIVVYSFMYFNQLLGNVTEKNILSDFNFWLVSGYLLYFLGSFIILLLYRTVDIDDSGNVWAMQNIILFLSSLITLVGYFQTSSPRQYY